MLCQMKRVALNTLFSVIKGKIVDKAWPFENTQKRRLQFPSKKGYSSLSRGLIYQARPISRGLCECREDCIFFRFFPEFDYSFLLF
jgi:hypothetical protein